MMIISQNQLQISENSKLNPEAPEYFPNNLTHHYFTNNNYPPFLYPPPQTAVINLFYRRHFFYPPHLISPTPKSSSLYQHTNNNPIMLPTPPISPTKPAGDSTRMTEPGTVPAVRKARKPKKLKLGRVPHSGAGTWFWAKKDVINNPVALSSGYPFADSTSLMIRNIPVRYSRSELMELLDEHCRLENEGISQKSTNEPASQFDFLYLPVDFRRKGNLGYAFVNMTTWEGASRLFRSWNGSKWENCRYNTKKICQISRAKYQGKEELRRHFEKSVFRCETDEYLPVVISPPRNGANAHLTHLTMIGTRVW